MLKQSSQPLELTYETFSLNSLLNALKCLNQCVLGPCPCVSVQLHCNEKSQKIDQKKKKKKEEREGGREGGGREGGIKRGEMHSDKCCEEKETRM